MSSPRVIPILSSVAVLFALTTSAFASQELKHRPQNPEPKSESSLGVLSHVRLTPFLRGNATLRFSPDGRYLLLQDAAGLFVISRDPLQLVLYEEARDAYPARFSNDSQTVSLLARDLSFVTWLLADGKGIDRRELLLPGGCLDAQLVAGARWFACLSPQLAFQLFQSGDLKRVYSESADFGPSGIARIPVPLHSDSPFAGPFGFAVSTDFAPFANRGLIHLPVVLSPDAKFILVNHENNFYRLSLPDLTKTNLPGPVRKLSSGLRAIQAENRILALDPKKGSTPSILSLTTGEVVASPSFSADGAVIATNPRYALLSKSDSTSTSVFDLDLNKAVDTPANLAADIHGDTLALYSPEGELQLYRLGEQRPVFHGRLPLGPLPALRAALVDPSLSTLAIAVNGAAAIFDVATGNRLADPGSFDGLRFASAHEAFWLAPRRTNSPVTVQHWTSATAKSSEASEWKTAKFAQVVPSAAAFIEYTFHNELGVEYRVVGLRGEIPFQLRALDPASGRELWKRAYLTDPPVPFNDPQGDRLVLGWKAQSGGAHDAAKRIPGARESYKNQKLKDQDSFFEVLDSITGNPLGGVLVQFGSGPLSFDSAFSCGDALFLTKDQQRLSVFHLPDGKLLARLRGVHAAANGPAKRFVLDEGEGKLGFYDLSTGEKLAERRFPDGIAYLHFSENGDRLFVLANHQESFVLDMKKTLEAFAISATGILK